MHSPSRLVLAGLLTVAAALPAFAQDATEADSDALADLKAENQKLRTENEQLKARVQHLEEQLTKLTLALTRAKTAPDAGDQPTTRPTERVDPDNPQAIIKTSMGTIRVELYEDAAPKTVANFLHLAEGTKEFTDTETGKKVTRPFYDGLTFHRVIDGFMIQGGCPKGDGTGSPGYTFADEINADALGLDKMPALNERGQPHPWLGIRSVQQLSQTIHMPLIRSMGITSQEQLQARQAEVTKRLMALTLKDAYANLGYKYDDSLPTSKHPLRGRLAMANSGPNTNGSQFFVLVGDAPWLTGRHTVFGRVIEGMDVADKISKVATGEKNKPTTPVKIVSIRKAP